MRIYSKVNDIHDITNKGYVDNAIRNAITNSSIQVETMPVANADNLGVIYEYIGATTASYTNGFFYKCVSDGESTPTYSWEEIPVQAQDDTKITHYSTMPTAEVDYEDEIVQYIGADDAVNGFVNGYFYKCVSDGEPTPAYSWEKIQVSDGGDTIQVDELPTASADELGNIYEFVGTTTANYINGRFYRCVSDGAATPTYSWEEVDFGDGTPHWSGTRAEYEAIKDTLEVGTIVSITDDYDDGLEVVDVIENGNMNPVTSNAVYDAITDLTPVDAVTDGNMRAVTSNAVYDAIAQIKTETKARYKALSFNSIPGVTFAKRDNNPKALSATRVDNIIVLNYAITIQGTYTGASNWLPIFNASQLDSLLDDDEILNDSVTPYFCSGITYTNNASYNKLDGVMNGYYLYFYNTAVFDMGIQGQIILGVQKTS